MSWIDEAEARCEATSGGHWSRSRRRHCWRLVLTRGEDLVFVDHARTDLPRALRMLREVRQIANDALDVSSHPDTEHALGSAQWLLRKAFEVLDAD